MFSCLNMILSLKFGHSFYTESHIQEYNPVSSSSFDTTISVPIFLFASWIMVYW